MINKEKLKYLMSFMEEYLCDSIDEVLNDSKIDPHFSAVAVNNMIKCYIEIERELDIKLPYNNVMEFFKFNAYTKDEYNIFEESRKKESQYYTGKQY